MSKCISLQRPALSGGSLRLRGLPLFLPLNEGMNVAHIESARPSDADAPELAGIGKGPNGPVAELQRLRCFSEVHEDANRRMWFRFHARPIYARSGPGSFGGLPRVPNVDWRPQKGRYWRRSRSFSRTLMGLSVSVFAEILLIFRVESPVVPYPSLDLVSVGLLRGGNGFEFVRVGVDCQN